MEPNVGNPQPFQENSSVSKEWETDMKAFQTTEPVEAPLVLCLSLHKVIVWGDCALKGLPRRTFLFLCV